MKKKIIFAIILVLMISAIFGKETIKMKVIGNTEKSQIKKPAYMGVYTKKLSMAFAREKDYPYNYGLVISGVVSNSPAEKQGLVKDDIIVSIDSLKVIDERRLVELIRRHHSGDKSTFSIFRDGKVINIDFVFGSRKEKEINIFVEGNGSSRKKLKRHKLYVGSGNFYWNPTYVQMKNLSDMDAILTGLQFNSIDDSGILMNGFTAEGKVGRNIFLGFTGQWYKKQGTINVQRIFYDENGAITANFKRDYSLNINFMGASLVKKIGLSKRFVTGFGMDFGGGKSIIMVTEKYHNDNIDNPQIDWSNLNDEYSNAFSYENHLTVEQDNWIVHPKISLEYKILDWLGIKSSVGYLKSYSPNGWETKLNGSKIEVSNKPNSKMDGPTYSIGLTFGG
jgi:hypothetical protein